MSEHNAVAVVYNPHTEAEAAVKELHKSEFDMPTVSLVGKDSHTVEHVIGLTITPATACSSGANWGPCGAGGGACCSARPALREEGHAWHCDTWCVISALSAF